MTGTSDKLTLIFAAKVIHPHPSEDASPSISAVVVSVVVSDQVHNKSLRSGTPVITDLYRSWKDPMTGIMISCGMIKGHLSSFRDAVGEQPERIKQGWG
ncbi:hypothetical protein R1flu_000577 [Riccia fluitans]|uniref:Uncharacterized protein n=1 Tax=Riccia fluitans TaxID=41844 RepID=A0ABD1Y3Z9_9MARC